MLVMVIAQREACRSLTATGTTAIHTYHQGGLDFLDKVKGQLGLPRSVTERVGAATSFVNTESNSEVFPEEIPARDQLLAYAATIAARFSHNFRRACAPSSGPDAGQALAGASRQSLLVWQAYAFLASGGARSTRPNRPLSEQLGQKFGHRSALGYYAHRARTGGPPAEPGRHPHGSCAGPCRMGSQREDAGGRDDVPRAAFEKGARRAARDRVIWCRLTVFILSVLLGGPVPGRRQGRAGRRSTRLLAPDGFVSAVWAVDRDEWFVAGKWGVTHVTKAGRETRNTRSTVAGLFGESSANVFALGYDELVLHFDGKGWVEEHFVPVPKRGPRDYDDLVQLGVLCSGRRPWNADGVRPSRRASAAG